ncbi:McrB family protein [Francisella salina]|uniref:ATPase dynein-related AAA domain-containing protein n=1 Tax=Francisella salina TaxID=573569 RepID=A0ABN3ZP09_FRAST|nr:AAA family ATPase [Francisella salina]AEI36766.1 hypothetical protein F7308_1842 [Francisella salina]
MRDDFRYIVEKAEYFHKLKNNEEFLFNQANNLDSDKVKLVQQSYENKQKINQIRYLAANLMLDKKLDHSALGKIKKKVNSDYPTDITKSWKKPFSILYVYFYNPIKDTVVEKLNHIVEEIKNKTDISFNVTMNSFDGAQNFGSDICWIALYDPKKKSQSEGIQYFINISQEGIQFGTYKHQDKKHISRTNFASKEINSTIIDEIVKDFEAQKDLIFKEANEEYKMGKIMIDINSKLTTDSKQLLNNKKQIILYGPAGTGKTYNTKNIIVNHAFDNVDEDKIDERYKELQDQGRVEFVTFHQSFAYEDFIEGIKPNLNEEVEGNISYKVENGIFKELCEKAKENYINSFKSTQQVNHEQQIKQKFISFVNDSIENEREFSKTQKNKTFTIISIDSQSLVINSDDSKYNNHRIEIKLNDFYTALGYEEREKLSTSKEYALKIFKRTTQWQVDTYILNILKEFDKESKNFKDITETKEDNKLRNYYLIIDEINRGNISKIFGELITLLESSKRLGEDNELTTTLPYSKDEFGIPPNLYIIGTMNTSDKSIAHLDIALRRRFGFVEMLPKYDLKDGNGENLLDDSCAKLLEELNQRIEILLDKDHLIGHSFFCGISENESNLDNKISTIMQNEIVPLLEEYFYGDYEKIQLVLGNNNLSSEKFEKHEKYKDIANIKKLLENSNKETKYDYWFQLGKDFDSSLGEKAEDKTE